MGFSELSSVVHSEKHHGGRICCARMEERREHSYSIRMRHTSSALALSAFAFYLNIIDGYKN